MWRKSNSIFTKIFFYSYFQIRWHLSIEVQWWYLLWECTLQSHGFLGPLHQEEHILDISHLKVVHLKSFLKWVLIDSGEGHLWQECYSRFSTCSCRMNLGREQQSVGLGRKWSILNYREQNKLAKLRDAIALSDLKLSMTHSLTHWPTDWQE